MESQPNQSMHRVIAPSGQLEPEGFIGGAPSGVALLSALIGDLDHSKTEYVDIARKSMTVRYSLLALVLAGGVLIAGCDVSKDTSLAPSGFAAEVSGAATGRVAGPGLIQFVPASPAGVRARAGYFFVADGSGVRELGITFTIPADAQPGTYKLVSAGPLDTGSRFEVRVDRSEGDRTESFHLRTEGTITLKAFPEDGNVAGQRVIGSFDFSTQDRNSQEISGKGSFDFSGR